MFRHPSLVFPADDNGSNVTVDGFVPETRTLFGRTDWILDHFIVIVETCWETIG